MRYLALAALLLTAGPAWAEPPTVLLVGDSTMAPQTGYGDALCERLEPAALCLNLGRGGRSSASYRAEGLWTRALARLRARPEASPAWVLIQFGHNDQPGKPGRSTDLQREYPANLARYVEDVRALKAQPVLVTPLRRRQFSQGVLQDDLQPWAQAMRGVAQQLDVPLLDLHRLSGELLQSLGEAAAQTLAQAAPGQPGFDHTHLGARGACFFSALLAAEMARKLPELALPRSTPPDCDQIPAPALASADATLAPPLNPHTYTHAGWAVGTLGGRGGRIIKVNTLADQGPGSLRAALEAKGPRIVVFEVGGVIDLGGRELQIVHPFITIAGQTAPAPGISLIKGGIAVRAHDVIVQHLSVRPGAYGRAPRSGHDHDGIGTQAGAHHVIVDHCSLSWATDENLSVGGPRFQGPDPAAWRLATSHHITYSNNLVFEGLSNSVHAKGEHSKGSLIHDNASAVLLLGNVYASNRERNALFKGGVQAAMINNLIYNPGARAAHYNLLGNEWQGQPYQTGKIALVGNVLRHGPDTPAETPLFSLGGQGDVELHLADNLAHDRQGGAAPLMGRYSAGAAQILPAGDAARPAYLPPRLQPLPARQLEDRLLHTAGARPWDRDPIDAKLLSDVLEGRGQIIDSETQSSGFPRHAPRSRAFDAAAWDLRDMSPKAGWTSLHRDPKP